MSFLQEFIERGYLAQCTDLDALKQKFNQEKIYCYIGFDCTANTLHAGSLIQIMILRLLQKHGHYPIVLLGGGTTKIGDPSGKDEARKILDNQQISENLSGIKRVLEKFIDFSNNKALIINNVDWLENLNYIDFLRDVGKHFSINRMLTFDSVKTRLDREQPLSFLEFNYMILQAFDFYYLHKNYNCTLQIGGSDQWGNIVNGVELIRKLNFEEKQN
ncbi:MAG: tyrosine--tRNA ligase, partial [Alphaproteobacteria bacterium]